MKKILTLFLIFFTFITGVQAQKADGGIKGKLVDTTAKQPIADATVSVLNAKTPPSPRLPFPINKVFLK
jgi:hypothetical protein